MQQYFGINKNKDKITLNPEDYKHIKNVMRFNSGEKIIVVCNNASYLTYLNEDLKSVTVIEKAENIYEFNEIVAYIPILPEEKMDFIFQKGTELGITKFIPVEYSRCKFKIKNEVKEKKILRWNKIVKSASEQSHRLDIPTVEDIISFDSIKPKTNVNILCSTDKDNVKMICEVLNRETSCDTISIAFGPEGGLKSDEEESLIKKGFIKTSLGKTVLRSETVILFVASIIRFMKLGE